MLFSLVIGGALRDLVARGTALRVPEIHDSNSEGTYVLPMHCKIYLN